jgi:hypothetical protein
MILDDIVTLLADNGLGASGVTLFAGRMPETPDACAAVLASSGTGPEYTLGGNAGFDRPNAQIMVRNLDLQSAITTAEQMYAFLRGWMTGTVNGATYLCVALDQTPIPFGPDSMGRYRVAVNIRTWRRF